MREFTRLFLSAVRNSSLIINPDRRTWVHDLATQLAILPSFKSQDPTAHKISSLNSFEWILRLRYKYWSNLSQRNPRRSLLRAIFGDEEWNGARGNRCVRKGSGDGSVRNAASVNMSPQPEKDDAFMTSM